MPAPESRPWQVRLLDRAGGPVGGGVLVDDTHVLTCAHVVREALGLTDPCAEPPAGRVRIDFVHSETGPLEATVELWADVSADGGGDVAVLALAGPAPRDTEAAPVRRSEGILGHGFDVLGFPRGYDDGLSSAGTIRRASGGGGEWVELSVPSGTLVERGFSGSPILDEDLAAIVGIVVGSDRDREHRVAWMIPVRTLVQYWPPLDGIVRHWSMYPRSEFVSHWSPRSRGVERHSSGGSFFTGRRPAMAELSGWLATGPADGRVRAVTGGPGSGKSAVLARLAVLADPLVQHGNGERAEQPAAPIDVAVHARGKTTADILTAITSAVGMPPSSVETWSDDLARLQRPLTVLVDALDEALEPLETATLLRRTAALGADGPVKVLVGTRPGFERELLHQLGARTVVLDLDDAAYLDRDDIAEYVRRRLTSPGAPYEDADATAQKVADVIATRSYPSFLLAQLSTSALTREGPVDFEVAGWETQFAESVADGWRDYLDGFGDRRRKLQDLLMPLAYAQGAGLGTDDDLWPRLASTLSGRQYDARDIEWLLEHAAAYLVQELVQDDRSMYRLYHQTLVEYFRRLGREAEAWRRFARLLINEVPVRPDGFRDWPQARAYSRAHLPTHAAEAGLLGELVTDPLFLAVADPGRLARILRTATDDSIKPAAAAYLDALPELGPSVGDNLNYLNLAAKLIGPPELADQLDALTPEHRLSVLWATTIYPARGRYLAEAAGGVAAFAPVVLEGRTCLAVCARDGTIRIWDADGYAPRGPDLALPGDATTPFLTVATVNGHPGLLAGRHDRLFVVDLIVAGGETITPELISTVTVEDVSFTCITAADIEGGTVIAIGCHDGTIELRRLDQLEEWSAWSVHQGPVLAVQLVDDVLVTAGADGTAKVLRVSPDLELSGEATFEVTGTWANESRLTTTADQVSELVVGYADGSLDGIRSDAEERLTLQVTAPTQYGTYHETLADGMSTTTTVGSDTMKTFEEVVQSERERRRQAREREAQQQAADLALPGDGPEPTEQNGAAQEAEEDGNFRIVALRAGTTSVDVTSVGSRVLMVSGGYDGRVVLVEDDATFHVLQGAGSDIATVRFVHTGDRWNVVAADRGASGAVRSWALSDDGAPLAEDPTSLGALPSFMATVNLGAGNAVLTWAQGQDVALRAVRTGSARFLGTDLADQPVLELVVGSHAGQDVVAALIEAGEDDRTLRAWSLADGRLLLDQHLTSARDIWGLVLRNSELVALTTAEGASQVVRWNLGEPASGPAPVELRRIGESVWGDEVPYLEGRLRPLPGGPPSLVFSVGETWASVVLVDLEQGTAQEATDSYSDSDSATAITLNGRPAVVESLNGTVEVLVIGDADEEPERVATLEGAHPEDLTVLAGTTDATVVAAGGADGTVRVWQDLRPEPEVFAFRSPIRELEIAADGTILVLCNRGLVALRPRTP